MGDGKLRLDKLRLYGVRVRVSYGGVEFAGDDG
jgi:hypothetical protein